MLQGIGISVILLGCSGKSSDEKRNHEAIVLHNSMVRKSNIIENRLNELKGDSTVSGDSISNITAALRQWKNDLVEVPGNEAHNHAGHNHNHHRGPDVTPEQMLDIQKELDVRLSAIAKRTTNLKPDNNHEEHIH